MPRILLALSLTGLAVVACSAPALKDFASGPNDDPPESTSSGTGDTSSTSTGMSASIGSASSNGASDSDSGTTSGGGASTTGDASTGTGAGPGTSSGGVSQVCGDGEVAGEEECDDGNDDDGDRCANNCTKNRWVFASKAADHNGDLGGLEAIDSRCRQYALQSGQADDTWKSFIAWVSDADHDVRDRLFKGKGRYVRTDGVTVVEHVDDFFSGTLAAPINVDEFGDPATGGALTGTMPDGTAAPGTHCANWTADSLLDFSLYAGSTGSSDAWWTMIQNPDVNPTGCIGQAWRLYCIEGE